MHFYEVFFFGYTTYMSLVSRVNPAQVQRLDKCKSVITLSKEIVRCGSITHSGKETRQQKQWEEEVLKILKSKGDKQYRGVIFIK